MAYNDIRKRQARPDPGIITSGTLVVGSPTGTSLQLDSTASPISFALPNSSTSVPTLISAAPSSTNTNAPVSVEQPIPVRTLVGICVGAFVLVTGLVIFVLWFGARSRRNKNGENLGSTHSGHNRNISGFDYMKSNLSGLDGNPRGTPDEVHLKGITTNYTHGDGPPLKAGFASEPSSYYSQQSVLRSPAQTAAQYNAQYAHHSTEDGFEQQEPVYTISANYNGMSNPAYAEEPSFLPKQNVYSRSDMAPVSPTSPTVAAPPPQLHDTTPQSSPRSQSAQPIVRPYAAGAHPYAKSHTRTASIEYQGNYAVATALPELETVGLPPSSQYYSNSQGSPYAGSSSAVNGTFAKAGARPGYDAYGIEPRQPPAHSNAISQPYSQQAGRQPIQSLSARPSLESIRSIARKASIDRTAAEVAADFALGGPQAVGAANPRSRGNSIDSSKGRGIVAGSQYGGSAYGGPAYTASIYSSRSGKEGKGSKGDKEKISKSEKKREMEAMENLIAALDESAMRERKRKEALAEAAGLGSATNPSYPNSNGWRAPAGGEEIESPTSPRRRRDVAITGSYPLPPTDVFRAALTSAGRGRDPGLDDEIDDEEIERWRRR